MTMIGYTEINFRPFFDDFFVLYFHAYFKIDKGKIKID